MSQNVRLYPWFRFFQSLTFWQAVWFLFFQQNLTPGEAIMMYVIYDVSTMAMEVPSGYLSDRLGRRLTLIVAAIVNVAAMGLVVLGDGFLAFGAAQVLLGSGAAFASGTDSALLYESLSEEGRDDEVESHELLAWRASYAALALSAVSGGLMSLLDPLLPFIATGAAGFIALGLTMLFTEPAHARSDNEDQRAATPWAMVSHPVLGWLFVLSLFMYAFSHVPFVFGQPFILQALTDWGLAAEAPAISGAVTTTMMLVSLSVSVFAKPLRERIGVGAILLLAIGMQVWLIGMLALSNHIAVIALLVLRMVPDGLSRPFILARIQPLLADRRRATYLSLQSFCGRLALAGSLLVFAAGTSDETAMPYPEIQTILLWYLGTGLVVIGGLALTVRAVRD